MTERERKLKKLEDQRAANNMQVNIKADTKALLDTANKIEELKTLLGDGVEITNVDRLVDELQEINSLRPLVDELRSSIDNLKIPELPDSVEVKGLDDLIRIAKQSPKHEKIIAKVDINTLTPITDQVGNLINAIKEIQVPKPGQTPEDYIPTRRVVNVAGVGLLYDDSFYTGGGGGGGSSSSNGSSGATTIADGADITEGATSDAVVAAGASGTISAKLRRLTTDLDANKTSVASLDTKTPTVGQKTMAASSPIVIASDQSAIPVNAGTNLNTSALALDATLTGGNEQVQGNVASGSTDSGNPVKVGGRNNTTKPTLTDGQRGDLQLDTRGNVQMSLWDANSNTKIPSRADNADGVAASSTANNLAVINRNTLANGSNWDRQVVVTNATNSTGTGITAVGNLAQFDDVSPTAITENQFGNLRISTNRNLYGTIRDAAGNERGANIDANNNLMVNVAAGLAPAATALNTYAVRITTNTTTTPTSSTAYISSITITTEVAGTTSTVTVRDKQGTPQVLINGLTTTAASLTPTVVNFQTPVKMTSGIDIVTAGAVAGTVDVWVNYYQ